MMIPLFGACGPSVDFLLYGSWFEQTGLRTSASCELGGRTIVSSSTVTPVTLLWLFLLWCDRGHVWGAVSSLQKAPLFVTEGGSTPFRTVTIYFLERHCMKEIVMHHKGGSPPSVTKSTAFCNTYFLPHPTITKITHCLEQTSRLRYKKQRFL